MIDKIEEENWHNVKKNLDVLKEHLPPNCNAIIFSDLASIFTYHLAEEKSLIAFTTQFYPGKSHISILSHFQLYQH